MTRLRLIHWKSEEAEQRASVIRALGYEVDARKMDGSSMKEFRSDPPAAVVIDLSRLPSHGREVAVALRQSKSTRLIPLVFVEGDPDKVRGVKKMLPDARFTSYARLGPVLEDVLQTPVREAVVPKPLSGPDSPTPLAKKLGLKYGEKVAVVNAPVEVWERLPDYELCEGMDSGLGMHLWFVRSEKELRGALGKMVKVAEKSGLWILWPKKGSGVACDLNGNLVRELVLPRNLVDFKICAFDETWSGMRFAVRKKQKTVT